MKRKFLRLMSLAGLLFAASSSAMADATDNLTQDAEGFYLLGNLDDWKAFAQAVNDGSPNLNARLTADIEGVTENECLTTYSGHLDGQCHKLTVNINRTADDAAPIYVLKDGGIVENLWTAGTITSSAKYACGVCAEQYASTIRNVVTTIEFNCTVNGDGTHGGIAGKVWTGSLYENVVFAGKYNAPNTYSVSGINGYNRSSESTFNNCLSIADNIIAQETNSYFICREKAGAVYYNCYYTANPTLHNSGNASSAVLVNQDQLKSGEVCFLLNGDQQEIRYYQNLGEDDFPMPFKTHKQVYTSAEMRCDGQVLGDGSYTNDAAAVKRPDHQYEDGFCKVCGEAQEGYMSAESDGSFNIGTPSQYKWMVDYINKSENKAINMRLTADVDIDEEVSMITKYSGTFDGQGHSLTYHINADRDGAGIFVTLDGTLKNIALDGAIMNKQRYSGAVAGYLYGRVENVISQVKITTTYEGDATTGTIGGISYDGATLKNVLAAGSLESAKAHSNAGIIGWSGGTTSMENVAFIGAIESLTENSTTMIRNTGYCSFKNCYYLTPFANHYEGNNVTQLTQEEISNGSLCYKLNGNSFLNASFYQTLGDDEMPVLDKSHGLVYAYDETYSAVNDEASFNTFRNSFLQAEKDAYSGDIVAEQALVDKYLGMLDEMTEISNLDAFLATYQAADQVKKNITASQQAYIDYKSKVGEMLAQLNQDPEAESILRSILREYLEGSDGPSEELPNGCLGYILENHTMSAAQLAKEIEWMEARWAQIVNSEYAPNTDITSLLTNADFSDGVNGWEGSSKASPWSYSPNVVESWNYNSDTYQTVNYLKNGVYEITMNGYLRPGGRDDSHLYASYLYANGMQVPLQYIREDLLPKEQAVNQENCLTGSDVEFDECYYPGNAEGASYAFKAGRYMNRILVNVTDGKLTLGVRAVGTGMNYDWTIYGCTKLYYRGNLGEATEALDNVLAGQVKRAQSILDTEIDSGEDVRYFPNFSNALRDQLKQYIQEAATAAIPEERYALIEKFSPLFTEVLECQKAYTQMTAKVESMMDFKSNYLDGYMTQEQKDEFESAYNKTWAAYTDGLVSTQEAQDMSIMQTLSFYDKIVGTEPAQQNGFYVITNATEFLWFSQYTNTTNASAKAILANDIDMAELIGWMPIGLASNYTGMFDGQGYSIKNFKMNCTLDNSGLFSKLRSGATVKNFSIYGDMTCSATNCGVIGYVNSSFVKFIHSYLNITAKAGSSSVGGVVGAGCADNRDCTFSQMNDCSFSGTMTINSSGNFGGLCGWTDWMEFINCANYGNITVEGGATVGGIVSLTDQSTFPGLKHCLNLGTISGSTSSVGALIGKVLQFNLAESSWNFWLTGTAPAADTNDKASFMNTFEITAEEVANGYLCERLNKNLEKTHWFQNVGTDAYPRLYGSESDYMAQNQKSDKGDILITSAAQLSSNASDRDEGQHIEYLLDDNSNTFWHTDWHGQCPDEYHYLQVLMNKEFSGEITLEMTRRKTGDDHPTEMIVWASKDGVEYTEVTRLNLPYEGQGSVATGTFTVEGANYLRFAAANCTGDNKYGYRKFWHAAEFQLYGKASGSGISTISGNVPATQGIYNLNGQRLSKLQKGINIVNGKKLFVK